MIKCILEIYGLPYAITNVREVELRLRNRARLTDVIAALKHRFPKLEGSVIYSGENRLMDSCMINVNGRFYFQDSLLDIKEGDRLKLLSLATGG